MSALVGYDSSDDDEARILRSGASPEAAGPDSSPRNSISVRKSDETITYDPKATVADNDEERDTTTKVANLQSTLVGPQGPPSDLLGEQNGKSASVSSYLANRATIRNLTMPTTPNLDIPESPLGSPSPGMEQKFEHFSQLKKQGVHFNEKLARSSALKNPALLHRLMASAGLRVNDQYTTALPETLWNPAALPEWAYKDNLAKSQQQMTRELEESKMRRKRERVDFVSPVGVDTSINVKGGERLSGATGRASAAERVATGLEEQYMQSIPASERSSNSELERRPCHSSYSQSRPRSRSPRGR
ncbi:MAG: hypothetical protein Q9210_000092 [Variospora velana]